MSDEDIDADIERIAAEAGDEKERVKGQLSAPEHRERIKYKLLEDRTVELLFDKSTATDAPPPVSEDEEKADS